MQTKSNFIYPPPPLISTLLLPNQDMNHRNNMFYDPGINGVLPLYLYICPTR